MTLPLYKLICSRNRYWQSKKFRKKFMNFLTLGLANISKIFYKHSACTIFPNVIEEINMNWWETYWKTTWKDQVCTCLYSMLAVVHILEELTIKKSNVRQLWYFLGDRYFSHCLLLGIVCRIRLSRHIASTYRIAQIRFCDSCCWAAQGSFRYLSRGQHSQNDNHFPH